MTIELPIPDYAAARRAMVEGQLRPQGVNDPAVLAAMGGVRRELFVPEQLAAHAYIDRAIAIGGGRMLSEPSVIGLLLTQMAPLPREKALIVGAGTGYSAAVLMHMGLEVVALECSAELAQAARTNGIEMVIGPLAAGWRAGAPYQLILIDGAVEQIPDPLIKQLAEGGRLGGALTDRGVTRLIVGRKAGGGFGHRSIADSGLGALPGFERPRTFTF